MALAAALVASFAGALVAGLATALLCAAAGLVVSSNSGYQGYRLAKFERLVLGVRSARRWTE